MSALQIKAVMSKSWRIKLNSMSTFLILCQLKFVLDVEGDKIEDGKTE